ncbi:uncharacterized protein LOC141691165 [Apium graveolens]|uniref:uncharacterized protein LOC141691165 n=1 Tax=Apium graveolens TaxID=4045 RepID=UPI003D7BBD8A
MVQIVTDQPLKKILTRPEASGRVVSWSIELSEYHLEYIPRTFIKVQALAGFMVECTFSGLKDLTPKDQLIRSLGKWKLLIDGPVVGSKCGARLIISSPEGFEIFQAIRFTFSLANNEAEYEAFLAGMDLAKNLEAKHQREFNDCMLSLELGQVGREDDIRADALSRLASAEMHNLTGSIYLIRVRAPSIDKK